MVEGQVLSTESFLIIMSQEPITGKFVIGPYATSSALKCRKKKKKKERKKRKEIHDGNSKVDPFFFLLLK